ncbi:hypothetical protein Barb6_01638 [Bacteroidales bacterium Barb6]|nr:hypothetical protein Barb6_01638 [Bacteroidales bacterium Barb6]
MTKLWVWYGGYLIGFVFRFFLTCTKTVLPRPGIGDVKSVITFALRRILLSTSCCPELVAFLPDCLISPCRNFPGSPAGLLP